MDEVSIKPMTVQVVEDSSDCVKLALKTWIILIGSKMRGRMKLASDSDAPRFLQL